MSITREYTRLDSQFWIGDTGRRLRSAGTDAQLVALYLLSSPHSNMLGVYYVSVISIAHETGLTFEAASKGLQGCIEANFCSFDGASEFVWVHEMARHQIADFLSETDKRAKGIQNAYDRLPENPWLAAFFDRYAKAFNMQRKRIPKGGCPSPFDGTSDAPSEPHRSQAQEQEQEQEQAQAQALKPNPEEALAAVPPPAREDSPPAHPVNEIKPNSRAAAISLLMRRNGIDGCNASNPHVIEWANDPRVTDDLLLTAAAMALKREVQRPGPNYLAPIVAELMNPKPAKVRDDWQRSDAGISRRAAELGIAPRPGETFASLKDRVFAAQQRANGGTHA